MVLRTVRAQRGFDEKEFREKEKRKRTKQKNDNFSALT
jgi:hypothetical protein